jgi:hypothetical protein
VACSDRQHLKLRLNIKSPTQTSTKTGLATVVIGLIMIGVHSFFALYFLVPLLKLVYPSVPEVTIATASGTVAVVIPIFLVIIGIVLFFIGRKN